MNLPLIDGSLYISEIKDLSNFLLQLVNRATKIISKQLCFIRARLLLAHYLNVSIKCLLTACELSEGAKGEVRKYDFGYVQSQAA
jgi:hypothetical protein